MEEFIRDFKLKNGKGTWVLLAIVIAVYLAHLALGAEFDDFFFLDDNIKKGQFWRLVSSSILHCEAGHLLMNASWLVFLCYQVESKFGLGRLFVALLILSVFSSCAEYLLFGKKCFGFSAVNKGLGMFIWRREISFKEKFYFPLMEKTFLFGGAILAFVVSAASSCDALFFFTSPADWLVEFIYGVRCSQISHTGHLSGALCGWLLGGLPYFCYRRQGVEEMLPAFQSK